MKFYRFKTTLIIMSGVLISFSAYPQKTDDSEVNELFDVSLEELLNVGMISASKKKQSVSDAPATAHVFTEQQIYDRGYTTLLDLLEDVPEVEIQRNSNPEFRNLVTFRGLAGNEKFLILMNGVRITPATGDSYIMGANFSLVNAKRVEVIIGPASALYGVDAFTGIINIITKTQEGSVYKGSDVNTSFGQYNTSDNTLMAGTKVDKLQISLAGHGFFSAEPKYNTLYKHDYSWYNNQYSPNGLVVESPFYNDIFNIGYFERNAGESFTGNSIGRGFNMPTMSTFASADLTYENFTVGYIRHSEKHSSAYGLDPKYTAYEKDAFFEQIQNVIYGRHTYTSFNRKWGIQSTFTQNFYEINPNSHFIGSSSRWQRGYVYANGQSSKIEEQFNYDFSSRASLVAGISFENLSSLPRTGLSPKPYDKDQPAELQDIYFIGAAGYDPYALSTDPVVFNDTLAIKQKFYNLNYQNYGAYAQMQLSPAKFIDITIGSRFDHNTRFGSSINPRIGLVLSPVKKIRVKLLYGEAFLAPSPEKAYRQSGAFFGVSTTDNKTLLADYFRVPNPELKPEKMKSLEFGLGIFLTQNLSINLNGAYTEVLNAINLFGQAPSSVKPDNISATRLESSINQGSISTMSFTGRMNYLIRIGKVSLNNFASYTFIDGQYNSDFNDDGVIDQGYLQFAAKHTIKGGFELTHRRFSLCPRVIFRSASNSNLFDIANDAHGNYHNDPYAIINLMSRYHIKNKGKLRLAIYAKVSNLLDRRYYNVYSGNEEGMPLTPQDPIRINVGFNVSFH